MRGDPNLEPENWHDDAHGAAVVMGLLAIGAAVVIGLFVWMVGVLVLRALGVNV